MPGKSVEWLADGAERGYPAAPDGSPRAYICVGTTCTIAATPQEMAEVVRAGQGQG